MSLKVSALAMAAALTAFSASAGQFEHEFERVAKDSDAAPAMAQVVLESALPQPDAAAGETVFVPVPILDPTLGTGVALTGLYTFSASADPAAPRSTLGGAVGYTSTGSWLAGAGFDLHPREDRYRISLLGGYGRLNLDYYGVGPDSPLADHPVGFSAMGGFGELSALTRIFDGGYLGLTARYLGATFGSDVQIDALSALEVDFSLFGIGPAFEYDDRDNSWWPRRGSSAAAELLFYDKSMVSGSGFATFDSRYARYVSLKRDLVLASEVRGAWTNESAPFFMYPFVTIRGFSTGQLLDVTLAQAQVELRWSIWRSIGIVAFAGVGATAPDLGSFSTDNLAVGFGGGVRYRVSDIDKMNVGLDLAYGDGDVALYFRIGEAF